MRRFRLFATPRNLGHHAKETSGALGGIEQGQFLGNYAIEGKLLQLCKGEGINSAGSSAAERGESSFLASGGFG